jgi:hypothetical protein
MIMPATGRKITTCVSSKSIRRERVSTGRWAGVNYCTFGERGCGLGVEAEDEVEEGHEDAAAPDAADGAERRAEEAHDCGHHQAPVELEILKRNGVPERSANKRNTSVSREGEVEGEAKGRTTYGPDARRARGEAEGAIGGGVGVVGGRVGGGDDEAGEDGGAGGRGGDVGEESPRAGPVEAAVQGRWRGCGRRHAEERANNTKQQPTLHGDTE